jgi:hypothetical protein
LWKLRALIKDTGERQNKLGKSAKRERRRRGRRRRRKRRRRRRRSQDP